MKFVILTCCLTLTVATVGGEQSPPVSTSCANSPARSLDFWVGTWDVRNAAGQSVAESTVELMADGCAVLERYSGRPGPAGKRFVGAGLHVFDKATGKWRQLFSDTRPAVTQMEGRTTERSVIYEWTIEESPGKRVPKRYTLSPFEGGVRQLGERSDDNGKSWNVEFDLRYQLKAANRDAR